MDTLIIISRAHADTAFKLADEMHRDESKVHILFTGRGTHHLSQKEELEALKFAKLYTFETEFDSPLKQVKAISYRQFVKLLEQCERTFSWI